MFQCISYKNEVIYIPTTTVVTLQQKMSWRVFLARTTRCDAAGEKMSEWVFQGQQQWHCCQKISWWVFLARTTMCVLAERKKNWQMSIPRTRAVTLLQKNVLTTDSPELSERNKAFVCDVATVAQLQKLQGVLHKRQVLYGIIIQVTAVMQDYASHMFQTTCTKKENSLFYSACSTCVLFRYKYHRRFRNKLYASPLSSQAFNVTIMVVLCCIVEGTMNWVWFWYSNKCNLLQLTDAAISCH